MIIGLDHIALSVRDIDGAIANYTALFGRTPNWRGTAHGARHAWFQLRNLAIDLIATDSQSSGQGTDSGDGILGLGFAVVDLDAAHKTLERRGIAMLPVSMTESRDSAGATRQWRIAMARRKSMNGLVQFFVERRTDLPAWPNSPPTGAEDAAIASLDHVVIRTANPDRALALYGAKLGLDLRLDRSNETWGSRLMFFRCGDLVVEVGASLKAEISDAADTFGGLAWRVRDAQAVQARLQSAGFDVTDVRQGRKPGTRVFTVRNRTSAVPTLMIEASQTRDHSELAGIS